MKTLSKYPKIYLGKNNNEKIYLTPPSWDCDWYWGFGYLGNKNCHYHVNGLKTIEEYNSEKQYWNTERVNLYDGFKKHFGDSFIIKDDKDIWTLAELFETFYSLKNIAEVYNRGGSHMSSNPCKDIIKNVEEYKRINEIVLPQIFEEIYKILNKY